MAASKTGLNLGTYLTSFNAVEQLWVGVPLQSHGAHDALQGDDRNSISMFQLAVSQSDQQVNSRDVYHSYTAMKPPRFEPRQSAIDLSAGAKTNWLTSYSPHSPL